MSKGLAVSKLVLRTAILGSAVALWNCSPTTGTPDRGGGGLSGPGGGRPGPGGGTPGTGGGPPGTGGGTPGTGGGTPGTGGVGTGGVGTGGVGTGGTGSGGDQGTGPATVHLDDVKQLIRGFGINNNWAAVGSDAETLFGEGANSLDLNILRVGMGPDGEPYNGDSCYDDIDAAVQRGVQYIIATLWSPPANCKSNNSINDGGSLLESCYESWSDTIAAFPGKVAQNSNGEIYAMSPQNEADFASCGREEPCNGNYDTTTMTGAQAVAFQKIVGPKLRDAGVIPMSPESSEWIHVWSNQSASGSEPNNKDSSDPLGCGFPTGNENCTKGTPFDDGYEYGYALYSDAAAWAAFDIMGLHQYDTQVGMPWPSDVPQGDKEVWQTEMSGVKWWKEQGTITADASAQGGYAVTPTTHIQNGVAVARWVHSGLVDGSANAWTYWWYKAIDTDDNEGLVTKGGVTAKRFYTFGNFSRYVKPDYHRVNFTGALPAGVLLSSYKGDAGEVVIVAINETDAAVDVPVTIAGGTAPAGFVPYVTNADDNWLAGTSVAVTGGMFTASLPAMSVTSFVSE